jgi:hypothetical protein
VSQTHRTLGRTFSTGLYGYSPAHVIETRSKYYRDLPPFSMSHVSLRSSPAYAGSHSCQPVEECAAGVLRSLGEGGHASAGSAEDTIWITAVKPWCSTSLSASPDRTARLKNGLALATGAETRWCRSARSLRFLTSPKGKGRGGTCRATCVPNVRPSPVLWFSFGRFGTIHPPIC